MKEKILKVRKKIAHAVYPEGTEEKRLLHRRLEIDHLTGLANRKALDKALPEAEKNPHVAIVAVDVNNFGQVNKVIGHEEGDRVLVRIAHVIRDAAEEFGYGERTFRRGGDEFVVLASAKLAPIIATTVVKRFGTQQFEDVEVSLAAGVGATFCDADAQLRHIKAVTKS
ncbi:MAG TPA: GGDEF domain-containing protein [Candidatus Dormibacteraeota bacterium]|nr:GGDEF domain-containing protein [Candidatus Dormibacteraeota bacterium]